MSKTKELLRSDLIRLDAQRYMLALPIVVYSEANQRGNWRIGWARNKRNAEKFNLYLVGICQPIRRRGVPSVVEFRRVASRLLDSDNLAGAFKKLRDTLAAWFGVDDGPDGPIDWRYSQRKGRERGIEVEFEYEVKT